MKTFHLHLECKHWNKFKRCEVVFESDAIFEEVSEDKFKITGGYCGQLKNSLIVWKTNR